MAKKKAAHKRAAAKSRKRSSTSDLTPEASIAPGTLTPSAESSEATPPAAAAAASPLTPRSRRSSAHSKPASQSKPTPADPSSNATPMATTPQPEARPAPKPKRVTSADAYERQKQRSAANQSESSRAGRDIGELPDIVNPERRELCRFNLELFLVTFFPDSFYMELSPDHKELIAAIQHNILHGGLEAYALPRGSGKTTISECAVIWALCYGHRKFIALIGASADGAKESLLAIKTHFETNDLLAADFPEVCYPILKMEGITNRCRGQLYKGERTRMTWKDAAVVLPTIAGSAASGSVIMARGITGRIRGMKYLLVDGTPIRPDFVMVDDPQTEESAASEKENDKRIKVLKKAIIGLAGPGKKIAGIMPCTVIEPEDMADQILDQSKHPEWNGRRVPGLKAFPTRIDLWEKYGELRAECFRSGDKAAKAATKFYADNRAEMDAGGKPYWEARFNPDELSALQNLMNWWLTDPEGFAAEVQQQPMPIHQDDTDLLSAEDITLKQHTQERDIVPLAADRITAMIDVGEKLLWYCVMAWSPHFSGYVLRYGTWPEQPTLKFNKRRPKKTLVDHYTQGKRKPSIDTATRMGLDDLTNELLGMRFESESGIPIGIRRLMVDAGDRDTLVKRFVRERADERIFASFGRTPQIGGRKLHEGKKEKDSDRIGDHWRVKTDTEAKIRVVTFDTNVWKSRAHQRLATGIEERGSVSLYQLDAWKHELFAEHLRSETRNRLEVNGEECNVWKENASKDNDYFDTFVGCHVGASIEGCSIWSKPKPTGSGKARKKRRGPIKSRPL